MPVKQTSRNLEEHIRRLFIILYRTKEFRLGGRATWNSGPHWDGGFHKGRRRKSIWPKIADFVVEHDLYYPTYLKFVILDRNITQIPPPNFLLSLRALREFRQLDKQQLRRRVEIEWASSTDSLNLELGSLKEAVETGELDSRGIQESILFDTNLNLTPLFLYCLAAGIGRDDVADSFIDEAAVDYILDAEHYDSVCGELIPDDFKVLAREAFGFEAS